MTERQCALCRSAAELRESHVFPKFIIRWIRETSATGKMRTLKNLRRRHQDGPKLDLLCGNCEQRFSDHEKWYSEVVFRPKVDQNLRAELGHTSLLPFVVSLAWRAALLDAERLAVAYPRHRKSIRRAMEQWRQYLLSAATMAAGNHYFFPLPDQIFVTGPANRVNWYVHRTLDLTALLIRHRAALWWKIPAFAGISCLGGHALPSGEAHRVAPGGLGPAAWESEAPQVLTDLVMGRAAATSRAFDSMPEESWVPIIRDYRKNLDKWADGPAADLALLDHLNSLPDDSEGTA